MQELIKFLSRTIIDDLLLFTLRIIRLSSSFILEILSKRNKNLKTMIHFSRRSKQILNGLQLTLGLAILLTSCFCLSLDWSFSLGIPLGLRDGFSKSVNGYCACKTIKPYKSSTVHGLRFLIDQTAPLANRISNARLNLYSWSLGYPTLLTLLVLWLFDYLIGELKLYFILIGGFVLLLMGMIITFSDMKSSYLQVNRQSYKRRLIVLIIIAVSVCATSSALLWFLAKFKDSTVFAFRHKCPGKFSIGVECYFGTVR